MLKQLFKNAFQPKELKFGYNVEFVNGTLNHNPINKIKAGKCELKFENQTFIFKQDNETLTDNMSDVEKIRTWTFKGKQYFCIETRTYNEYKFSMPVIDNETVKLALLKPLIRIADAFNIDIQDDGESEE
jgi:hypothetical protein